MSDETNKPAIRAEAFLFVDPHAGYKADEAASQTAAPSLSRLELAWERLLRRMYFLGVVQHGSLSAAEAAHASKVSLSRFLHPGSNASTTAPDGRDLERLQNGYNRVVSDFDAALSADLQWFILPGEAGIDRHWTSGAASSEVSENSEYIFRTGHDAYSRHWYDVSDDPQYSMPEVAFKTLGEAWLRVPPKVTRLSVSEGIGPNGNPTMSERTYTVPRWKSSLPTADVEGVSSVEVDGVPRSIYDSVAGYGVNKDGQFYLVYITYDERPGRRGLNYESLHDIPARAPTDYPLSGPAGRAAVWPTPSVSVSRYADEGWEQSDIDLMPARLRASVAACFVPPAMVPHLRAEFPPPDGWRCGMAHEHGGVPYGDASSIKAGTRILYRATADGMDRWLDRMSRTATTFTGLLCDFNSRTLWRKDSESYESHDHSSAQGSPSHTESRSSSWTENEAYASGSVTVAASSQANYSLGPGQYWSGRFGFFLPAPSASGEASYRSSSQREYRTESGVDIYLDVDEDTRSWNTSFYLSGGVPVWSAPWSYSWSTRESRSGEEPYSNSGTRSSSDEEERVIPPEFMPFVERAEVFRVVTAESMSSEPRNGSGVDSNSTHWDGSETVTSIYTETRKPETRASEKRLVSLGVLDESGALPPLGLDDLLALCPPCEGSAPADAGTYGTVVHGYRSNITGSGEDTSEKWEYAYERNASRTVSGGTYVLVVDWKFDVEHDPFADSELNALWREFAEAGRTRAAALAAKEKADAALREANASLAAAQAELAALEAELASLDDEEESARRLAELEAAKTAAESAASDAEAAREAAELAAADAREALEEAEDAEEPDEEEIERLRTAYREAMEALMDASIAEESGRRALEGAEAALERYRALVADAEGARDALEAEISEAENRVSDAEGAAGSASSAATAAAGAYETANAAYDAILARIRRGAT